MDSDTAEIVAARGAQWMDANVPGWEKKVDIDCLTMGSPKFCVIGQQHDPYHDHDYTNFVDKHGLGYTEQVELGFEVTEYCNYDYLDLRKAWIEEIRKRI